MEKAVKITLILSLVAIVIVFGSLAFVKNMFNLNSGEIITASGESNIKVSPDLTTVYFFVETRDESAQKAKDQNNLIFNKVVASLSSKIVGLSKDDIKTDQFTVNENIEWDGTKSVKNGFIAQHYGRINLKDHEIVGKVIDAIINNNGSISSINFELSKERENEYKKEALKLASEDAKSKAGAIANGLGKELGDLVSVQTSEFYYRPWALYEKGIVSSDRAAIQEAVSINPSDRDVNAAVTVQYRLE